MKLTKIQAHNLFTILDSRLYITDDPDYDRQEYRLIKRTFNKVRKSNNIKLYQDEKDYLLTWIPLFITTYTESKEDQEDIQALEEILDKLVKKV
jgi:hypothetical protein